MNQGFNLNAAFRLLDALAGPGLPPPDWRTKWQAACELIWAALVKDEDFPEPQIALFADLLKDHARFSIARLIIPELRQASPKNINTAREHHMRILQATQHLRRAFIDLESTRQGDFDTEEFKHEKKVFSEAEMHRARVLLHWSGRFTVADEERLRGWLSSAPLDPLDDGEQ